MGPVDAPARPGGGAVTVMPDADVLTLFEQEAAERVALLGELLLRLDADTDVVASLFREAHTLKGAAVVVGLDHVAEVAHGLEEILAGVRAGDRPITPHLVDVLFDELDALAASAGLQSPTRAAAPASTTSRLVSGAGATSGLPPRRDTARVPLDRLDDLVRLADDATAAQGRLSRALRSALPVDPSSLEEVRALARVLSDLHAATLRARMVPIGALSTALGLAARDAARKTGKVVRCEVRGEDTELDRHVHEHLADALLHLVRNAVDHGIEPPDVRIAAGKLEEGTILIHAVPLGATVVVTVGDDGAGVDVAAVRQRAAELGIDAPEDDGELLQLLFRPGLSTATVVTEVSGRGVGLDAVREGMAAMRGGIEVASVPGEGCRFRITVPTTVRPLAAAELATAGQEIPT